MEKLPVECQEPPVLRAKPGPLRAWYARAVSLFVVLVLISSCGSKPKGGTVTGTVKFNGEVVPCGQIVFYGEGDRSASAPIKDRKSVV